GSAGFAGGPTLIRPQPCREGDPVAFRQRRAVSEQRFHRIGLQGGERGGPSGIDAFLQRQRPAGFDSRQGESGNLGGRHRKVFRREGEVILFFAVQCPDGAGIKGGEPAPGKIVVHLGFDRFDGGGGGRGFF